MPNPTSPPKDAVGNELRLGDVVTIHPDRPLILRVIKVDNGGIQTPQGVTPGVLVLGVTLTIAAVPGANILNVLKIVNPQSDELIKKLIETPS